MNMTDAETLCRKHMQIHLPSDWKFEWMKSKRSLGKCSNTHRIIYLNPLYVQNANDSDILDTILHEIAHAKTPYARHGWAWKIACRQIGAIPRSTKKLSNRPELLAAFKSVAKYIAKAPCKCGKVHYANRLSRFTYTCTRCGSVLEFVLNKPNQTPHYAIAAQTIERTPTVATPINTQPIKTESPEIIEQRKKFEREKREAEIRLRKMMDEL